MKKLNDFFHRIFYNNKFVAILSLVIALIIWLVVAVQFSPETTVTVKDVPVTVDYASLRNKLGLSAFGDTDFTVDVTLTGKRITVESKDIKDSITVTANTSAVTAAGNYYLHLDSALADADSARIDSLSMDSITVYFDYSSQEEFVIEPVVLGAETLVPEGYVAGDAFVSDRRVTVSGPESEVKKITSIVAEFSADAPVTETVTQTVELKAIATSNVNYTYITFYRARSSAEIKSVDITVPVYKIVTLDTGVGYTGKPENYDETAAFSYTVTPAQVTVGLPEDRIENVGSLVIKKIDFTELKPGSNTFTVSAEDVESTGCKILDGTKEFTVSVEVSGVESKAIAAPASVTCINVPEGLSVTEASPEFTAVTIVGSSEKVGSVTLDSTNLGADLSSVKEGAKGTVTVPVVFMDDDCWAYGEYYATVELS